MIILIIHNNFFYQGPPVLSWGEEGEGGFPHNLFGGDDAAAQQAVSVTVTFNLDGVGSRCCLVLGLTCAFKVCVVTLWQLNCTLGQNFNLKCLK